jgi:hypothetical protein
VSSSPTPARSSPADLHPARTTRRHQPAAPTGQLQPASSNRPAPTGQLQPASSNRPARTGQHEPASTNRPARTGQLQPASTNRPACSRPAVASFDRRGPRAGRVTFSHFTNAKPHSPGTPRRLPKRRHHSPRLRRCRPRPSATKAHSAPAASSLLTAVFRTVSERPAALRTHHSFPVTDRAPRTAS